MVTTTASNFWILLAAALVFLMQAGFILLEVGMVRRRSVKSVALKNLIDWIVCSLIFFTVGFGFMFGSSFKGMLGTSSFGLNGFELSDSIFPYAFFLFQLAFAGTSLTIVSGALSERVGFVPYLVGSICVGILIYPTFGHWVWGAAYESSNRPWLAELGFMDFAGSTVVHSLGA